jgi:RNA polymerase sigma factor (sigma-70 family)
MAPVVAAPGAALAAADMTDTIARDDALRRALAVLPQRQRAVIVLRFLEDLTERDTAKVMGCSVGTVKSQTSRALSALRCCLDRDLVLRGKESGGE